MTKMIQIRNVPDDLHRKLKVRAAQEGMTLSNYLLSEIESGEEAYDERVAREGESRRAGRGGRDAGSDDPSDA